MGLPKEMTLMAAFFTESKAPLEPVELDALEQRLAIKLPEEYRHFLLMQNGGRPKPAGFDFIGGGGRQEDSSVKFFLGVYDGEFSNFEDKFRTFKILKRRMPEELVPIANDSFGNYICLAITGKHKGAVFFWDHENEADEGEEPTYANVHLIKPSLQEFLDSLH
jgi:hypothetical protein